MSGFVHHCRPLWKWLGNVESWFVREQIEQTPIVRPIYVAGLARSGTSILIEILASHPHVATHQYRDFPFLFIPYWWRQTLDRSAPATTEARERAHGDRLMVTPQSPEAMEEVLWMAYFRRIHDGSSALNGQASNPKFERFYKDHIGKLLFISKRTRYAAKGNYNLTRLEYLLRLFPDARFILPVRSPRDHIASLMKQHKLFGSAAAEHPRSVAHLDRVGHFEFGKHRRCINPDSDSKVVESIEALWRNGEEARGWARYWASLYRWVLARLEENESLRSATLLFRYEDMCDRPIELLTQLFQHANLPDESGTIAKKWATSLSRPNYYQPSFTESEDRAIVEETGEVARALGYV
jgi:hypothetical protein